MPNKVKVVTAYCDLGLTKRPSAEFHALGGDLLAACAAADVPWRFFDDYPFLLTWVPFEFLHITKAANPRAEDRFATDLEHLKSNMIQHSPVQWLEEAAAEDPEPDVFVWLGYSLTKQGDFTGKPIRPEDVHKFLTKVSEYPFGDIPIPSIRPNDPIAPFGDNWQFVGSTIIVPRRFLSQMARSYRTCLCEFVRVHRAIPLDLAIWPAVVRTSGLPFTPYKAEYDATQLTNFPG